MAALKTLKAFPRRIRNPKSIPLSMIFLIKEASRRCLWIFSSLTTISTTKLLANEKNDLKPVTSEGEVPGHSVRQATVKHPTSVSAQVIFSG